jgi:hypothetical protein
MTPQTFRARIARQKERPTETTMAAHRGTNRGIGSTPVSLGGHIRWQTKPDHESKNRSEATKRYPIVAIAIYTPMDRTQYIPPASSNADVS